MNLTLKRLLFGGPGAATTVGDVGLLILRLCVGFFLVYAHGWSKLYHDGSFGPTAGFIDNTAKMGFPAPTLFAWMAVLTESLGAILLAIGLLTRPAAFALAFNMGVAAFVAHAGTDFSKREPALLYMVPFVFFIFVGAGRFSIDRLLRGNRL